MVNKVKRRDMDYKFFRYFLHETVIIKGMNGDHKMNNKTHIMISGDLRRIIYYEKYRG